MDLINRLFRLGGNKRPCAERRSTYHEPPYIGEKRRVTPSRQSTKEEWTCERGAYKYPINESPRDPWERCFDIVDRSDEELCKGLMDEISFLLVVASLFLAIVTAFSIESLKWLKEDKEETTTALLGEVVRLLNDTSAQGTSSPRPSFEPDNHDIAINQLWFLSMTLSVSAVVLGTLCLQWLSAFRQMAIKQKPHDDALALRQLRFEGLVGWGVPRVPAILLLTVQGAIVLFVIGLLYLLWSVNHRVFLPVAIVSGVSVCLLGLTTIMPLLQSVAGWVIPQTLAIPQCPFKSPISWVTHRSCVLLAVILSTPFSWVPSIKEPMSKWRKQQVGLLTDYLWREYDDVWRKQRERWGPQSKIRSTKYSYYLIRGFASAMETLVFHPHAVHIVHTCLQEFHETSVELEIFEELFNKKFTNGEKKLLKGGPTSPAAIGKDARTRNSQLEHLRKDFLNAHALQHFVEHNQKLHRVLLPHRVELYVRIKNSSQDIDLSKYHPSAGEEIGRSIECPIQCPRDVQGLSSELRIQFLNCASRLIDTNQYRRKDIRGALLVLSATANDELDPSRGDDDDELSSMEHRFNRVLMMAEKHLSKSMSCREWKEDGWPGDWTGRTVSESASTVVDGDKYDDQAPQNPLSLACQRLRNKLQELSVTTQSPPELADYFNHTGDRYSSSELTTHSTSTSFKSSEEERCFLGDCPV